MTKNKKAVEALKEQLPLFRNEADKALLNELKEAIKSGDPEKVKAILQKLESASPELQDEAMNATKLTNRTSIIEAYETLTVELGRFPTVFEIAAKTGLSKVTVYDHRKELLGDGYWQEELEVLKMQRIKFLNVLAKTGYKDARVAKMILDLLNTPITPAPANVDNGNTEKNNNTNN